jgi:hypothetical protein
VAGPERRLNAEKAESEALQQVVVSPPVANRPSLEKMGVRTTEVVNVGFATGQMRFLEYHRDSVLLKARYGGRKMLICAFGNLPLDRISTSRLWVEVEHAGITREMWSGYTSS